MNKGEATRLLNATLNEFRRRDLDDLLRLVDGPKQTIEATGNEGTKYYIDILVTSKRDDNQSLCIVGTIDDGGVRAFFPLTMSITRSRSDESAAV